MKIKLLLLLLCTGSTNFLSAKTITIKKMGKITSPETYIMTFLDRLTLRQAETNTTKMKQAFQLFGTKTLKLDINEKEDGIKILNVPFSEEEDPGYFSAANIKDKGIDSIIIDPSGKISTKSSPSKKITDPQTIILQKMGKMISPIAYVMIKPDINIAADRQKIKQAWKIIGSDTLKFDVESIDAIQIIIAPFSEDDTGSFSADDVKKIDTITIDSNGKISTSDVQYGPSGKAEEKPQQPKQPTLGDPEYNNIYDIDDIALMLKTVRERNQIHPWAVLGFSRKFNRVSPDELNEAYNKLHFKWHPDKNRDKNTNQVNEIFDTIRKAYATITLSDEVPSGPSGKAEDKPQQPKQPTLGDPGFNDIYEINDPETMLKIFSQRNYLGKLGFKRTGQQVSKDEIKNAYILLAKKWHPDKNKHPNARRVFEAIQEAYEKTYNVNY